MTHTGPTPPPSAAPRARGPARGAPPLGPLAVFGAGLVLYAVLAMWNHSRGFDLWRNYSLVGVAGVLVVGALLWRFDVRAPQYVQGIVILSGLLHFGGGSLGSPDPYRMGVLGMHGVNGAYHTFHWWDHLTHFFGIGAATMGFTYLLEVYQLRRGLAWSGPVLAFVAVLFGLAVGVGVELYEYLGKTVFHTIDQGGYVNTMLDLHFNVYGAVAGAVVAVTVQRTRFRQRIRAHWRVGEVPLRTGSLVARTPPLMAGMVAGAAIASAASLYLSIEYFFVDIPFPDLPLYDPALHLLTAAGAAALAAVPLVAAAQSAAQARRRRAAPPARAGIPHGGEAAPAPRPAREEER